MIEALHFHSPQCEDGTIETTITVRQVKATYRLPRRVATIALAELLVALGAGETPLSQAVTALSPRPSALSPSAA